MRPAPKPYEAKPFKGTLAVADFETWSFRHGRVPKPVCLGFFDGISKRMFWGSDCVADFRAWLASEKEAGTEYVIFMHNGGRFDFMFLLEGLDCGHALNVINGRIIRMAAMGHEFRDSWALFPQPLSAYEKDKFDYTVLEPETVEANRAYIERYCLNDCQYLYEIIAPFVEMYGDVLTVGSVAMKLLNSEYGFECLDERDDATLRPFFFGGRVQPFETGDFRGKWKLYDVNSMYPAAMRNIEHPVSGYTNSKRIKDTTGFVRIIATSQGCLPYRLENGRLGFPFMRGEFLASIHEIRAGQELGLLKVHEVVIAYNFAHWTNFQRFVDPQFEMRQRAKDANDKARDLIHKRVGNSGYGKFALDPRDFKEYRVLEDCESPGKVRTFDEPEGWFAEAEGEGYRIWERPTFGRLGRFLNVATAASITGAARANLMRGLAASTRPIYCDTDSIICEAFDGDIDKRRLGAWDLEAEADRATIAAKKIYALWRDGECIKKASKGARLSEYEIVRVANGELVEWKNDAPNFSFMREPTFVKRNIKRSDVASETFAEDVEC